MESSYEVSNVRRVDGTESRASEGQRPPDRAKDRSGGNRRTGRVTNAVRADFEASNASSNLGKSRKQGLVQGKGAVSLIRHERKAFRSPLGHGMFGRADPRFEREIERGCGADQASTDVGCRSGSKSPDWFAAAFRVCLGRFRPVISVSAFFGRSGRPHSLRGIDGGSDSRRSVLPATSDASGVVSSGPGPIAFAMILFAASNHAVIAFAAKPGSVRFGFVFGGHASKAPRGCRRTCSHSQETRCG